MKGCQKGKLFAFITALLAPTCAFQGRAQDGESATSARIEHIIVEAQKREQPVQDVPIAISAYSGEFLDAADLDNLVDISSLTSGFQAHSPSPQGSILNIRGILSMNFVGTASAEPRISVYQDGVSISRAPGAVTELLDVERVEVLKGPQGALFGRSAEVGAVQIIQNKAEDEFFASAHAAGGNFGHAEAGGVLNIPLGRGLAGRVAGVYKRRNGFLENTEGSDFYAVDRLALRGVLTFKPLDDLRLDLIANYQDDGEVAGNAENIVIPATNGDRAFGGIISARPFGTVREFDSPREIFDVTLLAELQASPQWTLQSISGYRDYESLWLTDEDGTAFDFFQVAGTRDGEQWSHELRALYESENGVSGFFGASVFRETPFERFDISFDERQLVFLLSSDPSSNPILQAGDSAALAPFLAAPPLNLFSAFFEERNEVTAKNFAVDVFAELALELAENFTFLVDGRWSYEDKSLSDSARPLGAPSAFGATGLITGGIPTPTIIAADTGGQTIRAEGEFSGFAWRTAVNWRAADGVNLWASYARGRRPDVLAIDFAGPLFFGIQTIQEETVDSYEAGVKSILLGGRTQFNASVYYYSYHDFRTGIFEGGSINLQNAGRASAVGFEVETRNTLSDYAMIFASYGFNDAEIRDTDENGNPQAFAGNRFAFSPRHSFSVGAELATPIADGWTARLTPVFSWQSAVFFDDENRPANSQDAYGVLTANFELGPDGGRWAVTAGVENALDKTYAIDGGSLSNAFGIPALYVGPPRLWRIGVEVAL